MAYIQDTHGLRYSDPIVIEGTEVQSASVTLQTMELTNQISGFVYAENEESGIPVASAEIIVRDNQGTIERTVFTDASGYYTVQELTVAETYTIAVAANGYIPSQPISVVIEETPQLIPPIALQAEANMNAIYGLIKTAEDEPIGDARIDIVDATGAIVASTSSADDGEYVASGLELGTYAAIVKASGYLASQNDGIVLDAETHRRLLSVTLMSNTPVEDAGRITGIITDETSATPLAGAWVGLYDAEENLITTATAGASGEYLFLGVLPGTYIVKAKMMGSNA